MLALQQEDKKTIKIVGAGPSNICGMGEDEDNVKAEAEMAWNGNVDSLLDDEEEGHNVMESASIEV